MCFKNYSIQATFYTLVKPSSPSPPFSDYMDRAISRNQKLVADIKTWSKNIIELDSIFVLSASLITTKRSHFYSLCISRYIYSMFSVFLGGLWA